MLRKQIDDVAIEKVANSAGVYRFIASDEKPDRVGDVIEVEGWDTADWEKNPVVLWGHRSNDPPVAKGVQVKKQGRPKQLVIDIQFPEKGAYPFADTIAKLVDTGFIKAVSVGFKPIDSEPVDKEDDSWWAPQRYKKQELLELSIVSVPMNPRALAILNSADRANLNQRDVDLSGKIVSVWFSKKVFTSDKMYMDWLKNRGFATDGNVIVTDNSYTVEVDHPAEVKDSAHFQKIKIEDGVFGLVHCDAAESKTNTSNETKAVEFLFKKFESFYAEMSKEHISHLHKLFRANIDSMDNLGKVVRDLAQLADLVNDSSLSTPGKPPVGALTVEMEKEIAGLQAELKSLITS